MNINNRFNIVEHWKQSHYHHTKVKKKLGELQRTHLRSSKSQEAATQEDIDG